MFCVKCGAKVAADALFCIQCGARLDSRETPDESPLGQKPHKMANSDDDGRFIWSFLAFCIPLVGLFLYLKWQTDRPVTAKASWPAYWFGQCWQTSGCCWA